jgi:hypothetical protein
MRNLKNVVLTIAAVGMLAGSVHAQATRDAFGPAAPAIEALIPQLYDGARLEWTPKLAVVLGDGTVKSVRIVEPVVRQESDGYTFVISIEFTDNEKVVAATLNRMEPGPETSLSEIVAFKTTPSFAVTAIHRGILASDASITRVVSLEASADDTALPWPGVFVIYKAYYATMDWVGMFEWQSKIATDPVTMVHRLPGLIAKSIKNGGKVTEKPVIIVRDDEIFDLYSKEQARFIMSCAVPCVPDGKVLLGLWGPTSTTVATVP